MDLFKNELRRWRLIRWTTSNSLPVASDLLHEIYYVLLLDH